MISSLHLADKFLHITKEYLRAVIIDKIHVDSVFSHHHKSFFVVHTETKGHNIPFTYGPEHKILVLITYSSSQSKF